jgi:hypothetical protein
MGTPERTANPSARKDREEPTKKRKLTGANARVVSVLAITFPDSYSAVYAAAVFFPPSSSVPCISSLYLHWCFCYIRREKVSENKA